MKTQIDPTGTTCSHAVDWRFRTAGATTGLLPLLLLLMLPAVVPAQDYTYTANDGTITITKYTGPGGAVTIPSTITGLPVTSIGDGAFANCASLTSVTIPAGVANIGYGAFYFCGGLTTVTMPNSVTNLADYAFYYCGSLAGVTIPNSVIHIGNQVFSYCYSLAAITVDPLNPAYSSVAGVLFNKSQTTLLQCPGTKAGSYTVPSSVTSIGPAAFEDCALLTSVTIPNSVASIGDQAFLFCVSLASMTIPNSVTNIGDEVFHYCGGLTNVVVPNRVTSIGRQAFDSCTSLTTVLIPNSVTNIGDSAFAACTSLASIYFAGKPPVLGGASVFAGDNALTVYYLSGTTGWGATFGGRPTALSQFSFVTSDGTLTITGYTGPGGAVTIPATIGGLPVTRIGANAFLNCSTVTSVTIPNSVTDIGYGAFVLCMNLSAVTIPNSVTNLAAYAFYYCGSLANVTIPSSVTNIGDHAFAFCASLTAIMVDPLNPAYSSVAGVLFDKNQTTLVACPGAKAGSYTVPSSVTRIGEAAFEACSGLTSVTIPNSVTNIADETFQYCSALTSVTIPNSITSIGSHAFDSCSSLATVSIPGSVSTMGDQAFANCWSLTAIYFAGSPPALGGAAVFAGDDALTVYYLPGTAGWGATFGGRPVAPFPFIYVTSGGTVAITGYRGTPGAVTIPGALWGLPVTGIGPGAFAGCRSLTDVTISSGITSIGWNAFSSCASLATVSIPSTVTTVGDSAFLACPSLTAITVDAANPNFISVGGVLFNRSQTTLIQYPAAKPGSGFTIPNSVTSVGNGAFFSCTNLTSIVIPGGVTDIGYGAFASCTNLTTVVIPSSVTSIGSRAFASCSSLTTVVIPGGVTFIGSGAFGSCSSLSEITVDPLNPFYSSVAGILFDKSQTTLIQCPGGKAGSYAIPNFIAAIGWYAFEGCSRLANVTIPGTVTNVGYGAFNRCTGLTNVAIPNSVTRIETSAFAECTSLASVVIPGSVTTIEVQTFWRCTGLTNVTIPNSVTGIETSAFLECSSLTSVTIPNSVSSIGDSAFAQCSSLASVTLPNTLTNLGGSALSDCTHLTSVTLPDTLTNLGEQTFYRCTSLTNLVFGHSLANIGAYAFYDCNSLTSLTIPNRVGSISNSAFAFCESLINVCFLGNAPALEPSVFAGDYNLTVYYLAGTTGWGPAFGGRPAAPANPAIAAQPQSQTVAPGSRVTFTVGATGVPQLNYQWRKNGLKLAGATQSSYSIARVQTTNAGAYSVAISNAFGSVISSNATLVVDGSRPTVTILTPTAGRRITNTSPVTISGKATDNLAVSNVRYQLNGTGWKPATPGNGWTNWSAIVSPRPGTNTVIVYAEDGAGGRSVTNSRSFVYVTFSPLTLVINGSGTVTPGNLNGGLLEVGRSYTVTASPRTGCLFSNWVGTLAGLPSSSASLRFVMQSNAVLTANFVTNPFISVKGSYYGLFAETNRAQESSGYFTLTLTTNGSYSGSLKRGLNSYPISGQFDVAGRARRTISRLGTNAWQLAMELRFGEQQLAGTISNGVSGGWVADLLADRAVFDARTNPATQYAGKYTVILPGTAGDASRPQGHGYLTIAVATGGQATLSGSLADNSNFTATVPVLRGGVLPMYASLYGGKGSVWSWLEFDGLLPAESLAGWLSWVRPPLPTSRFYPAGFTNEVTAVGSRYTPPASVADRVIPMTNGVVVFGGGNLVGQVTNQITLMASNRVINLSPNKLSLNLTLSSGLFSGSVQISGTTRSNSFKGSLLQGEAAGYGYFLGTNRSGSVYLGPLP